MAHEGFYSIPSPLETREYSPAPSPGGDVRNKDQPYTLDGEHTLHGRAGQAPGEKGCRMG